MAHGQGSRSPGAPACHPHPGAPIAWLDRLAGAVRRPDSVTTQMPSCWACRGTADSLEGGGKEQKRGASRRDGVQ